MVARRLDIDLAEHLTATDTASVRATSIGYDRIHGCVRRRTARTLNYRHLADFGLFTAYSLHTLNVAFSNQDGQPPFGHAANVDLEPQIGEDLGQ